MGPRVKAFCFIISLTPFYLCQGNINTEKESINLSLNVESDDSGSGDRTFTISLATANALVYNKSDHMKAGDSLRVRDNGGFALLNNEMDYLNCNSSNPLHLFYGNNASYTLKNPGTFYIICLEADLCNDGAKMTIKVQERKNTPSPASPHQISSDSSSAAPSSVPDNSNLMAGPLFWLIACTAAVLLGHW